MPSAAPATPLLRDRPSVEHTEALAWAERGETVFAVAPLLHGAPDLVLASGDLMMMPNIAVPVAGGVRSLMTFGGVIDVNVVSPRVVLGTTRYQLTEPTFAERFQDLRERLRLPVQKYALLLGTSRRTLYHWLETGRAQEQAIWRVERLSEWVAEIGDRLPPDELLRLMDPDLPDSIAATLITHGDEAAAERLRELSAAIDQPRRARRLPELADGIAEEPPTLADADLRAGLSMFAAVRQPRLAAAGWTPREVTDTTPDDAG